MEFKMGVEESQCKTEVSAKVYLENETKRKADKRAKEPLAKRSQNKSRLRNIFLMSEILYNLNNLETE